MPGPAGVCQRRSPGGVPRVPMPSGGCGAGGCRGRASVVGRSDSAPGGLEGSGRGPGHRPPPLSPRSYSLRGEWGDGPGPVQLRSRGFPALCFPTTLRPSGGGPEPNPVLGGLQGADWALLWDWEGTGEPGYSAGAVCTQRGCGVLQGGLHSHPQSRAGCPWLGPQPGLCPIPALGMEFSHGGVQRPPPLPCAPLLPVQHWDGVSGWMSNPGRMRDAHTARVGLSLPASQDLGFVTV